MAEVWTDLSLLSFVLALVFLLLSLMMLRKYQIRTIISELSSRGASTKAESKGRRPAKLHSSEQKNSRPMRSAATALLRQEEGSCAATVVLNETAPLSERRAEGQARELIMLEEIMFIHTHEVIDS